MAFPLGRIRKEKYSKKTLSPKSKKTKENTLDVKTLIGNTRTINSKEIKYNKVDGFVDKFGVIPLMIIFILFLFLGIFLASKI